MRQSLLLATAVAVGAIVQASQAEFDPSQQTADMPDSWLVLYNSNNWDSVVWARWYRRMHGIPAENSLGLNASLTEHLPDRSAAEAEIIDPVENYLAANPDIEQRIMGIVVGYAVPLHFGGPPGNPNVGGFSVDNALQDLTNTVTWEMNLDCPHMTPPYGAMPANGRLTKASMAPGHYMVARIDGATVDDARELTLRALEIGQPDEFFDVPAQVWYDYIDPVIPGDEWYWLEVAVNSPTLTFLDWLPFDSDTEQTANDDFRFGTCDINGWDDDRLFGEPTGRRVLALNLNSWGATTVRSCYGDGGRYVPNALAAGYAAAIGATGEPYCCVCPFPDTLLRSLSRGWTLGEAFYLANPYDDWMWTVVGDPLLALPRSQPGLPKPPGDGTGDETPSCE
jgi:uncharacterized protein (TIGR03790 family)